MVREGLALILGFCWDGNMSLAKEFFYDVKHQTVTYPNEPMCRRNNEG